MEASTVSPPAALSRITIGPRLLRLRSDEQLVALFRSGHDEAFRVIHDRYRKRLESYARQMLPRGSDAEDAMQDVFVRAYWALHANTRRMALRPWLFRVAHNRCIDELRRIPLPLEGVPAEVACRGDDPVAQADVRESLRRLIEDIRRLPDEQRSALLMRELGGISYAEVAAALDTSVPAVKSLLVRARMALVRASEARDKACPDVRAELVRARDEGVRAGSAARGHLRDCAACRSYRRELRVVGHGFGGFIPAGVLGFWSRVLGSGGSGATGAGGAGAGQAAALGGGSAASGVAVGANHLAALIAAAVASAGGAIGLHPGILTGGHPQAHHAAIHRSSPPAQSSSSTQSSLLQSGPESGAASADTGGPSALGAARVGTGGRPGSPIGRTGPAKGSAVLVATGALTGGPAGTAPSSSDPAVPGAPSSPALPVSTPSGSDPASVDPGTAGTPSDPSSTGTVPSPSDGSQPSPSPDGSGDPGTGSPTGSTTPSGTDQSGANGGSNGTGSTSTGGTGQSSGLGTGNPSPSGSDPTSGSMP